MWPKVARDRHVSISVRGVSLHQLGAKTKWHVGLKLYMRRLGREVGIGLLHEMIGEYCGYMSSTYEAPHQYSDQRK